VDERETRELDADCVTKTFTCSGEQFFRFVRLRQTGQNSGGDNYLTPSELELFGALWDGA